MIDPNCSKEEAVGKLVWLGFKIDQQSPESHVTLSGISWPLVFKGYQDARLKFNGLLVGLGDNYIISLSLITIKLQYLNPN